MLYKASTQLRPSSKIYCRDMLVPTACGFVGGVLAVIACITMCISGSVKAVYIAILIIIYPITVLKYVVGYEKMNHIAQNAIFCCFSSCHHSKAIRGLSTTTISHGGDKGVDFVANV